MVREDQLLIAIKGCERDTQNGFHQAVRDTWLKHVSFMSTAKFFVGDGKLPLQQDEERVYCPDDYMSLPSKTRAILRWMLDRSYAFIFLCDTDTFVMPERLLASGFEDYDLTGLFNGKIGVPRATEGDAGPWQPADQPNQATRYWAWISGGNGYWLSRRAAQIVVDWPGTGDWAEDRTIGQALGPHFQSGQLRALNHEDYGFCIDGDEYGCRITKHFCSHGMRRSFERAWMYNSYKRNYQGMRI